MSEEFTAYRKQVRFSQAKVSSRFSSAPKLMREQLIVLVKEATG